MDLIIKQPLPFYLVISFYCLLLAGVSIYLAKFIKNTGDFFRASGKTPWMAGGLSFFMTAFSASVFVANASLAYNYGLLNILLIIAQAPTFIFGYYLFSRKWHRTGCSTAIEFISARYGPRTADFFAWTGIPLRILDNANRLYVTAVLIEALFGMNLSAAIILTCVITIVYTIAGGFLAVVITDALQAIVMGIIVLVLAVLAYMHVGGIPAFIAKTPESYWTLRPETGDFNITLIIAWAFVGIFSWNGMWSLVQRYVSVEKEKEARKVSLASGISYFILFPLLALPPMFASVILPDLKGVAGAEQSYIQIAAMLLPAGLLGLLCFAIYGATVTALNSELNVISQVCVQDIFKKGLADIPERKKLLLSRGIIVLIMALCAAIAFAIRPLGGAVVYLLNVAGLTVLPTFMPILLGLLYRKTPAWGSIAAFSAGVGVSVFVRFVLGVPLGWTIFINGFTTACVFFAAGWISPVCGAQKDIVENLFNRLKNPGASDPVESTGAPEPVETQPVRVGTGYVKLFAVFLLLIGSAILLTSMPFLNGGTLSLAGLWTTGLMAVTAAALLVFAHTHQRQGA